jgi:molecular chaperone GrpE
MEQAMENEAEEGNSAGSTAAEAADVKAAESLDGWQRARADLANYKRRVEREQAEVYQNAAGRIIARYLEVMDDFDQAMQERPAPDSTDLGKWSEGAALTYRKFQNVLEAEGVKRIDAEGKEFDPALHEAMTHEECDSIAPGHVIAVVRQGYELGEKVIRPALVRVAK